MSSGEGGNNRRGGGAGRSGNPMPPIPPEELQRLLEDSYVSETEDDEEELEGDDDTQDYEDDVALIGRQTRYLPRHGYGERREALYILPPSVSSSLSSSSSSSGPHVHRPLGVPPYNQNIQYPGPSSSAAGSSGGFATTRTTWSSPPPITILPSGIVTTVTSTNGSGDGGVGLSEGVRLIGPSLPPRPFPSSSDNDHYNGIGFGAFATVPSGFARQQDLSTELRGAGRGLSRNTGRVNIYSASSAGPAHQQTTINVMLSGGTGSNASNRVARPPTPTPLVGSVLAAEPSPSPIPGPSSSSSTAEPMAGPSRPRGGGDNNYERPQIATPGGRLARRLSLTREELLSLPDDELIELYTRHVDTKFKLKPESDENSGSDAVVVDKGGESWDIFVPGEVNEERLQQVEAALAKKLESAATEGQIRLHYNDLKGIALKNALIKKNAAKGGASAAADKGDRPKVLKMPDESLFREITWMREKRLNSFDPSALTKMELKKVAEALRKFPNHPMTKLSVLGALVTKGALGNPDKNPKLAATVRLQYTNLINGYGYSTTILTELAKIFRAFQKDHPYVHQILKLAYQRDPTHAEVNYLCAMFLCDDSGKVNFGPENREMFLYMALASDRTNFYYINEYYHFMLGTISLDPAVQGGSVLPSASSPQELFRRDSNSGYLTNIIKSLDQILSCPSIVRSFPAYQRIQLEFLRSVAAYLKGEVSDALTFLLPVYKSNHLICMIKNLDETCAKYRWDTSILSLEKYKEWLQLELEESGLGEDEGSSSSSDMDLSSWNTGDSDGEGIPPGENEDYGDNLEEKHPIEHMLIYILRLI